jgi:hypothetical protein
VTADWAAAPLVAARVNACTRCVLCLTGASQPEGDICWASCTNWCSSAHCLALAKAGAASSSCSSLQMDSRSGEERPRGSEPPTQLNWRWLAQEMQGSLARGHQGQSAQLNVPEPHLSACTVKFEVPNTRDACHDGPQPNQAKACQGIVLGLERGLTAANCKHNMHSEGPYA